MSTLVLLFSFIFGVVVMGAPAPVPVVETSTSADRTSISVYQTSMSDFVTSVSVNQISFPVFETSIPTPTEMSSTFSEMRPLWQRLFLHSTRTTRHPVGSFYAHKSHVVGTIILSHYTTDQESEPSAELTSTIRPREGYNSHILDAEFAGKKYAYETREETKPLVEDFVEPSDETEHTYSIELSEKKNNGDINKPKQSEEEADLSEAQIHKLWTRGKYYGAHELKEATLNSREKRFLGITGLTSIFEKRAPSPQPRPPYFWYYAPDIIHAHPRPAKQSEEESKSREHFEKRDSPSSHRSPTLLHYMGPDGEITLPRLSKRFERELDDENLDKRDASRGRRKPPYVNYYGPFDSRYIRRRPTKRSEEETDHAYGVGMGNNDYQNVHPRLSKRLERELDDENLDKRDASRGRRKPPYVNYYGPFDSRYIRRRPTKRSEANCYDLDKVKCDPSYD